MDPSIINQTAPFVSTVLISYLGKEQLNLILGPTSKYLGEELLAKIKKIRIENIANILKYTSILLGKKINYEGGVPPRYISHLINEGSYIEDIIVQKYFAGILASSRTLDMKNDRGLIYLDLINKLSHYDIRAHNFLYQTLREVQVETTANFFDTYERKNNYGIWVFESEFISSIFDEPDYANTIPNPLIHEIMNRLQSQALISEDWSYSDEECNDEYEESWKITFSPTILGTQLFLWAYGHGDLDVIDIFNDSIPFEYQFSEKE